MIKQLILSSLACLATLALASAASAASAGIIHVAPAGDGWHHDELGTSYDFFDSASNGIGVYYCFYGTSDTVQKNTGFAQFDLSGIPAGAEITSATLNIYLLSCGMSSASNAGTIKHVANASSANGNASQKLGGTELVATLVDEPLGWVSFDITDMLASDLSKGYAWSAFSFNYNGSGSSSYRSAGFSFTSAEGGAPAFIAYNVPEPATLGLLALGAAALLRRRRV